MSLNFTWDIVVPDYGMSIEERIAVQTKTPSNGMFKHNFELGKVYMLLASILINSCQGRLFIQSSNIMFFVYDHSLILFPSIQRALGEG